MEFRKIVTITLYAKQKKRHRCTEQTFGLCRLWLLTISLRQTLWGNWQSLLNPGEEWYLKPPGKTWWPKGHGGLELVPFHGFKSMCVCAKMLQSCLTLWDPMGCSPTGSSVHGILQTRIVEWAAMPSSRGSSQPRDQTCISYISCIGRWVLYH